MKNNGLLKALLAVLLGLYVVSPVDLAPGPIDDLLLLLFTAAMNMKARGSVPALPPDPVEEYRNR